jgi:voltage-gated potassium channel
MNYINNFTQRIDNQRTRLAYDIGIAILSLLAVGLFLAEYLEPAYEIDFKIIDDGIIVIFVIDYFVRLIIAENKIRFIRSNIIDLLAIIPFSAVFQGLRIARLIRVARIVKVLRILVFIGKIKRKLDRFIKTNNFHYVLMLTIVTIFLGAVGLQFSEHKTFTDSIWWSFVTATTVGYGDISPTTSSGRIIAAILMITGIGFIGMLTGTISTFFIHGHRHRVGFKYETIANIQAKLDDFDNLGEEDIEHICTVLKSLKLASDSSTLLCRAK